MSVKKMKSSVASVVVGPYVHPPVWGGTNFGTNLRLLAVTPLGVLVWNYAGSMWGGSLSGTQSTEGSLDFLVITDDMPQYGNRSHKIIHSGGRLSIELLRTHRKEIETCIGAAGWLALDLKKCVLLDGAQLPKKAFIPTPKPVKPKVPAPDNMDVAHVKAALEVLRSLLETSSDGFVRPGAFTVGGIPVTLRSQRTTGAFRRFVFRLDAKPAEEQYAAEVDALRVRLKTQIDAFRADVPVRYGAPLVSVDVTFRPSRVSEVCWTPEHAKVLRDVVKDVFSVKKVEASVSEDRLSVAITFGVDIVHG